MLRQVQKDELNQRKKKLERRSSKMKRRKNLLKRRSNNTKPYKYLLILFKWWVYVEEC